MTTFKKLCAAILAIMMTVCLLAACGNQNAPATDPATKIPVPAGMLVLTAGASVSISYDDDGMVLKVDGINDTGIELVESYTEYMGKTCANVAKELIENAAKADYWNNVKNIVIKQTVRSELPGSHFLETIETDVKAAAEAAGSKAVITLIDEAKLDENGYINFETAKALLCNELGVEKLDKYYGAETPTDGAYICTAEIGGKQTSHNIDAVTGLIADATEEELLGDSEDEVEEGNEVEDAPSDEVVEDDLDIEVPITGEEPNTPTESVPEIED